MPCSIFLMRYDIGDPIRELPSLEEIWNIVPFFMSLPFTATMLPKTVSYASIFTTWFDNGDFDSK